LRLGFGLFVVKVQRIVLSLPLAFTSIFDAVRNWNSTYDVVNVLDALYFAHERV
jgi:hypothetical protein